MLRVSSHSLQFTAHDGGGGNVFDDAHELVRVTPLPFALPRPAGSEDEIIRVWDVNTQKAISTLKGHHGQVTEVAFDGSGRYIASGRS